MENTVSTLIIDGDDSIESVKGNDGQLFLGFGKQSP